MSDIQAPKLIALEAREAAYKRQIEDLRAENARLRAAAQADVPKTPPDALRSFVARVAGLSHFNNAHVREIVRDAQAILARG